LITTLVSAAGSAVAVAVEVVAGAAEPDGALVTVVPLEPAGVEEAVNDSDSCPDADSEGMLLDVI
jgi:hypothetical protein